MGIRYSEDALDSLLRVVNFVEKKNTQGAGLRWLEKFEYFLTVKLEHPQYISRCNNYTFKRLQLQCLYYRDWTIAFSVDGNSVIIEALLHNNRLID